MKGIKDTTVKKLFIVQSLEELEITKEDKLVQLMLDVIISITLKELYEKSY